MQRLARVYDGFLVTGIGFGEPLSIPWAGLFDPNQTMQNGVPATPFIEVAYPADIRTDQHVPVLHEANEFDVLYLGVGASVQNQADSNAFRLWEVAGTAHFDALADANTEIRKTYPGFPSITAGCTAPRSMR